MINQARERLEEYMSIILQIVFLLSFIGMVFHFIVTQSFVGTLIFFLINSSVTVMIRETDFTNY